MKFQITNLKSQTNPNFQIQNSKLYPFRFGHFNFEIGAYLEFGAWNLAILFISLSPYLRVSLSFYALFFALCALLCAPDKGLALGP